MKIFITVLQDFKEVETKVLLAERLLLHTLCFDVEVSHPYRDCFVKIKNLKSESELLLL